LTSDKVVVEEKGDPLRLNLAKTMHAVTKSRGITGREDKRRG
jgi:hypothetical protein